ncbi:hypothetical protein [Mycetocola spongiae]|uniref:hypothetical protein n=1 Tax=Mycetocola spongiae TaxID=2859226 RepID=UPI001CF33606|nr:hypothetical protein [Mycetocola spongiae]UCR90207.1 hypothetical protein KXZ72_05990 [Mycetocola spongiae]
MTQDTPTTLTPPQFNRARSLLDAFERVIREHGLDPRLGAAPTVLPELCVELVTLPRVDVRTGGDGIGS